MKKLLLTVKLFLVVLLLCWAGAALYVKLSPALEINSANNVILYDCNDNVFFEGSQSKSWVHLSDISPDLINATIYTEDK